MQRDGPATAISAESGEEADVLRLERALAEAEKGCRARDDLLSIAAHALRTPLTAILGWVTLLRAGDLDSPTAARAMDVIERNARRQAELIGDLIDATRILGRRLRLNRGRVDLRRVVDMTLAGARGAAEAREIRLHAALDPAAAIVWGDPDRLAQIVTSLLANAVKFSQPGGRVDVSLQRVGPSAELRVRDEGVGIPAVALPHLFGRLGPGSQDGSTEADRGRGQLGLGLSIASNLAEMHGGTLSAASEGPGRGATFTLGLPLRSAADEAEDEAPEPADLARLQGRRILIVSDEGDAREGIVRELRERGAAVSAAASSEQAMREVADFSPDVMVVDIEMRGEVGYDFIGRVRALGPANGGRTPAVALSSSGRADDRVRTLRAGFQIHVTKPVPPLELAAVLARLGARRASTTPEAAGGEDG